MRNSTHCFPRRERQSAPPRPNLWGVHLPYGTYDISATDETVRTTAVAKLKAVITSVMKHMSPKHFVIHPSTGTILTTGSDFAARKVQSRKSLRELQTHIASCNSTYGLHTILCVENCPRSVAYDAETMLALLSGEGLEQVRVCLDTGHALIPLNGSYINPTRNGDAVAILRKLGTRLGTLHIQQNPGAEGQSGTLDKHLAALRRRTDRLGRVLLRTAEKQPLPRLFPLRSLLHGHLRRYDGHDRIRQSELHGPRLSGLHP